jgi:hypothetical protein
MHPADYGFLKDFLHIYSKYEEENFGLNLNISEHLLNLMPHLYAISNDCEAGLEQAVSEFQSDRLNELPRFVSKKTILDKMASDLQSLPMLALQTVRKETGKRVVDNDMLVCKIAALRGNLRAKIDKWLKLNMEACSISDRHLYDSYPSRRPPSLEKIVFNSRKRINLQADGVWNLLSATMHFPDTRKLVEQRKREKAVWEEKDEENDVEFEYSSEVKDAGVVIFEKMLEFKKIKYATRRRLAKEGKFSYGDEGVYTLDGNSRDNQVPENDQDDQSNGGAKYNTGEEEEEVEEEEEEVEEEEETIIEKELPKTCVKVQEKYQKDQRNDEPHAYTKKEYISPNTRIHMLPTEEFEDFDNY